MGGWWGEYSLRCQPVDYSDSPSATRVIKHIPPAVIECSAEHGGSLSVSGWIVTNILLVPLHVYGEGYSPSGKAKFRGGAFTVNESVTWVGCGSVNVLPSVVPRCLPSIPSPSRPRSNACIMGRGVCRALHAVCAQYMCLMLCVWAWCGVGVCVEPLDAELLGKHSASLTALYINVTLRTYLELSPGDDHDKVHDRFRSSSRMPVYRCQDQSERKVTSFVDLTCFYQKMLLGRARPMVSWHQSRCVVQKSFERIWFFKQYN